MMSQTLTNLSGILALAFGVALTAARAQVMTLTNPAPVTNGRFGHSMAAMGSDRVIVGALGNSAGSSGGGAYLFATNGILLATFTNPPPSSSGFFGWSVAGLGTDKVLVGAVGHSTGGVVYLFGTNGALITALTNPTPHASDNFGIAVAAVGDGHVLIGAWGEDTGAPDAGAAYLFGTNGNLLTTITNPAPSPGDLFGYSVLAMGTDRMLIGAYGDDTGQTNAGKVYLFSTNGTLLIALTNPAPTAGDGDLFGRSMAVLGNDRILVGAEGHHAGAINPGEAYLFNTNGELLATFTNPAPAALDLFGRSVTVVGNRVLIGAWAKDLGAIDAGVAYLFHTNGALLMTITNPTPVAGDGFGRSLLAVGNDRVLIGALGNDTGATDAGTAYLFSTETPAPLLLIRREPASALTVSWPAPAPDWVLEFTNTLPLVAAALWPQVLAPYQTNAGTLSMTLTNLPGNSSHFFRLHKP